VLQSARLRLHGRRDGDVEAWTIRTPLHACEGSSNVASRGTSVSCDAATQLALWRGIVGV
jgi:hypothetical protein